MCVGRKYRVGATRVLSTLNVTRHLPFADIRVSNVRRLTPRDVFPFRLSSSK